MCEKIEIELDQDKKLEIDIISKAFNMDRETFLKLIVEKEIDYIKCLLEFSNSKEELESYYKFEINMDELGKLILVEDI